MLYISNAIAPTMFSYFSTVNLTVSPISTPQASALVRANEYKSVVRNKLVAQRLSEMLGVRIEPDKSFITLKPGDQLLAAGIKGGKIDEESGQLPDPFDLKFVHVVVE